MYPSYLQLTHETALAIEAAGLCNYTADAAEPMYAEPDRSWSRICLTLEREALMNSSLSDARQGSGESAARAGVPQDFLERLARNYSELLTLYRELYGGRPECMWDLERLILSLLSSFLERPASLQERDRKSEQARETPGALPWYQRKETIGAMCYVDRFAGTIAGVKQRLDYLESLGVNYLHIMPPFSCPSGRNDGGYAVSSYREVRKDLGTIEDLEDLAAEMHDRGMRLVLDFVFNHTSDEHAWARSVRRGNPQYLDHYYLFPDRQMPDRYDSTLREIFPEGKRGSFVYSEDVGGWVWSTFNPYQWDLNYSNPQVLQDMVGEMLTLANRGVDVLRLDALAFTWKELGTACENLPRVHSLIRLFHLASRIVAPSVEFKSEAIVHPDEVLKYLDEYEARLSYNPLLMALSWEALATRKSDLLLRSVQSRYPVPASCTWVNYVRCHDDIGWTFSDEEAAELGLNASDHRNYLNRFYTGREEGSYARGVAFQLNPATGDCRICGTAASLAGIEMALSSGDEEELERGISRFIMLHAIMLFVRGIPVFYLGDEYGQLNDYAYVDRRETADDSRWAHRPKFNPDTDGPMMPQALKQRIRHEIDRLIAFRVGEPECDSEETRFTNLENSSLLVIQRPLGRSCLHVVCNLADYPVPGSVSALLSSVGHNELRVLEKPQHAGKPVSSASPVELAPRGLMILRSAHRGAHHRHTYREKEHT